MRLPNGYEIGDVLSQTSSVVTVPASGSVSLFSFIIPSGSKGYLADMTAKVIDAGSLDITFTLTRNGQPINPAYFSMNGSLFDYVGKKSIDEVVDAGTIELKARSVNGADIRLVADLTCYLLKAKEPNRILTQARYVERY